jgi:uncharacterized OB-fold protein
MSSRVTRYPGTEITAEEARAERYLLTRYQVELKYSWSAGNAISRFLTGLRDGELWGRRCTGCGRTMIPPRMYCEQCFRPTDEWVRLQDAGRVVTYSVSYVNADASRRREGEEPIVEAGTGRILAWKDGIPLHYEYTAGTAGEAFLRGLKAGRIVASKCGTCGEVRLPPRTYCLLCYGRTRVDIELFHSGRIAALSTAHLGVGGVTRLTARSRTTFGFVTFEGVRGGLVHRIVRDGRREPRVGDPVRPLFPRAEKRKGSILDLEGFRTQVLR